MKPMSRLGELIEDWKYVIKRDGILSGLLNVSLEIARLPYRHLRFVVIGRSLSEPLPDIRPKIDLKIRPFEQPDLQLVGEIDRPSEAIQCARHLNSGHKGLVAIYENQLAGYAWGYAEVNAQFERVHIPLAPGDILCTDVFTTPAFRGQGVQTALSLARFRMFRELGFHRAICYIEIRNFPSLAVWQRKLSGLTIGSIDFLRVGAWYRVRFYQTGPLQPRINRGAGFNIE